MTTPDTKRILIDSYNRHAQERDEYPIELWKIQERANFLSLIKQENKQSLLEVGAGTGKDSKFFTDNGLDVISIDLSPEMIKLCQQKGLSAHVMDVIDLKFAPSSFDIVYALNSFLHISEAEFMTALENVNRVLKTTGLFYLGVYGGQDFEGIWEKDSYFPKRFFSLRTDEHIQRLTTQLFELLSFKRTELENNDSHFQSLILRKPNL
jgi:SAM-dependent methyltransferase